MKRHILTAAALAVSLAFLSGCSYLPWGQDEETPAEVPVKNVLTVSPEILPLIDAPSNQVWLSHPQDDEAWAKLQASSELAAAKNAQALAAKLGVSIIKSEIGGVTVRTLRMKKKTPEGIEATDGMTLLYLHGGGYVLGGGLGGVYEALLMTAYTGFDSVCVDYRLAPSHPYPAATDDALAVYRELLKTKKPESIGVYGTSTGGAMTLILALQAKAAGLPMPGALAAGTPWTDLTKTGDSYFKNDGVDNVLTSYEGLLSDAVRVYAGKNDLKDPFLSPVYGDVTEYPPTIFVAGTRDLFLSNTVRMHTKLRENNIPADLLVFEAMSHAQYYFVPDAPETKLYCKELGKHFAKYLKK